ncbi:class II fructose-bisphosphatase [Neoehrlichia mikurensis]|uniref:Fructose-1,6-bisphosphatase n=1 Tax=Neoehrlichia mikurensis TaxID=89586 RepID=A0A9Q9BTU9_9RICK|nr:class II fructose-bisphosphatase [Neoehrlichia mikurensis]UTO55990.1 class II fructose-bisphosphatase [Neoehrlichia mikurensis]UTO56905.1 class II fructose-bisphosphatase [Neoehrlichia mikurensis]
MQDLCFKFLKVTEAAAIKAYNFVGMGDEIGADKAAVDSMRMELNLIDIDGTIVIGEGERDNAPMLYIGEKIGRGGYALDIAVDPLEGTTICSNYKDGAMSVIAIAESGGFLKAPDIYMEKIAVGPNSPEGVVSLNNDIKVNLGNLSDAKKCSISDLVVIVLNRERHLSLINSIRECGARVKLIDDGDISAVLSLVFGKYDLYVGIGGAPEGVLAAAALLSIGGYIEGKLMFNTDLLVDKAKHFGIRDINKVYTIKDMVKGKSAFIATGITDSNLVRGVEFCDSYVKTHSIIIKSGNIMYISNKHI